MSKLARTARLQASCRVVSPLFDSPRRLAPKVRVSQEDLLLGGRARDDQRATVYWDRGVGRVPTVVLGGFLPDSTEQLFSLRRFLRRSGNVYYVNYPRLGFSTELLFAQLDDLLAELTDRGGRAPVLFGVSFGAGLLVEWLRRTRQAQRATPIAGSILISPVACTADVFAPGGAATSLLGRALEPYLAGQADPRTHARSRALFTRMFESGAQKQNERALANLMTADELAGLRRAVRATIGETTHTGACERVQALLELRGLGAPPECVAPLSDAPTLILYSEKESGVLTDSSPTRRALDRSGAVYFPRCGTPGHPR